MKTLIILLISTVAALGADYTISTNPDQERGLAHAVAQANAEIDRQNAEITRSNEALPEGEEPKPLLPNITAEQYLTARVEETLNSYAEQERKSRVEAEENQQLIEVISRQSPEKIQEIKAAIQRELSTQ